MARKPKAEKTPMGTKIHRMMDDSVRIEQQLPKFGGMWRVYLWMDNTNLGADQHSKDGGRFILKKEFANEGAALKYAKGLK